MSPDPTRFRRQRDARGMATPDTIEDIIARVQALLSHDRRMTVVRRITWQNDTAPEVFPGLTLANDDRAVNTWKNDTDAGISVLLEPGIHSFGLSTSSAWDATEEAAWARYHREKADGRYKGPENFTEVIFRGGLPNDGPARDDQLTINAWNSNGVCIQTVIGFDYDGERPRRDDKVAAWLKANRDQYLNPGIDGNAIRRETCYMVLDTLLDEYRQRADEGRSLVDDVGQDV